MSNWMTEKHGVPHKNGHVRFYVIGFEEDTFGYLGWYDMTDWDKGWKKMWDDALKIHNVDAEEDNFRILRHDQLLDLKSNVDWALQEALEDKDETTMMWWWRQEKLKEKHGGKAE